MAARLEEMRKSDPNAKIRHEWVPYNRISNNLKRALIAAEDAKFLDHEGFDWEGIQKAYEKDLKKGRIVAGGSTISQQLSKNLLLSGKRSPWRKAQESVITLMIEHMMSKKRILELYLNSIEWGNGVFGAEAAAQYYYGTDASRLSPVQAARLASMVPNPRYFDKHRNSAGLLRKTGIIMSRMNSAQIP
jgi:monofunctional biosynthetic peptidoglycan transglycosylase